MTRRHTHRMTIPWRSLWLCGASLAGSSAGRDATSNSQIECWDVFEVTLTGPTSGNPYVDVEPSATFTQGAQSIKVPGFWDGGMQNLSDYRSIILESAK